MNPIHFFTLGYFDEYLPIGIVFGIVIGLYAFFRIKYALSDSKWSKNKKLALRVIVAILAFVFCLNRVFPTVIFREGLSSPGFHLRPGLRFICPERMVSWQSEGHESQ